MRPKIDLRIAINLRRRWRFKTSQRGCTIEDKTRPLMRLYVDLRLHWKKAQKWHRSKEWMIGDIIGTHIHEYAHAFIPVGVSDEVEEKWAERFERAGQWARRNGR